MSVSDQLSDITLSLVLLVTFLSYKLRWRDSSFMLLLVCALLPAIYGKVLIYIGPDPKVPLFLFLYVALAAGLLVWGLIDRHVERMNG